MVLKFYMQPNQTAGLQGDKIQPGRESKTITRKIERYYIIIIIIFIVFGIFG